MIQAQELRIANKIYRIFKTHRTITDVVCLSENTINFVDAAQFEPIPLSPQVLDQCGFEKGCNVFELNNDWIIAWQDGILFMQIEATGKDIFMTDICERLELPHVKYLHQLQNCIHALTGQELNYKP